MLHMQQMLFVVTLHIQITYATLILATVPARIRISGSGPVPIMDAHGSAVSAIIVIVRTYIDFALVAVPVFRMLPPLKVLLY